MSPTIPGACLTPTFAPNASEDRARKLADTMVFIATMAIVRSEREQLRAEMATAEGSALKGLVSRWHLTETEIEIARSSMMQERFCHYMTS